MGVFAGPSFQAEASTIFLASTEWLQKQNKRKSERCVRERGAGEEGASGGNPAITAAPAMVHRSTQPAEMPQTIQLDLLAQKWGLEGPGT